MIRRPPRSALSPYTTLRRADTPGDILLRQAFGHDSRPVAFDRALVEELGEAAVDVLQGQVTHLPDETAHSTDQHVDQVPGEQRVVLEQSLDIAQRDHETAAR